MTTDGARVRADVFLVRHGYAVSRAEAQAAIEAGNVSADGARVTRSSQLLAPEAQIQFEKAHPYVSRGALKLVAALEYFDLSPAGKICLDIGASTGGFTQVLLEQGAAHVYALDVGHGQLHAALLRDPRVTNLEGINARELKHSHLPEAPEAVVADVSFIGLQLALSQSLARAGDGAWLIALVKPQFEVGRAMIGKGGIVRDMDAQKKAVDAIANWLKSQGWPPLGALDSPIAGGDGNREFLVAARKS
jgi:23S rRNA (cytidine1920-2'-O)/16S rRNA (cytidine1409-2'-O)-methyltransferase